MGSCHYTVLNKIYKTVQIDTIHESCVAVPGVHGSSDSHNEINGRENQLSCGEVFNRPIDGAKIDT